MGATVLDSFTVQFGIDSTMFKKGEGEVSAATARLRDNSKKTFGEIEKRGNDMATAFKGLRNEVIGLGLAVMGAGSITGLVTGMLTGAANADRLGRSIGVATGSVYAWRKAVKETGGQSGEADAALQSIAAAQTGYAKGTFKPGREWSRLGITSKDLQGGLDPSGILQKIGQARGKFTPKNFDSLLQDVGLPASIRYLLEDPTKNIKDLIKGFEKDTAGQAKMAKEAEELQKTLAELNDNLTKKLTPAVIKIAEILNKITGGSEAVHRKPGEDGAAGWGVHSGKSTYPAVPDGDTGGWGVQRGTFKGKATRAERNNNPGNIEDGRFARSQPGYAGGDGRFARFASPGAGIAAMEHLLGGYMRKGRDTIASIVGKWAPSTENNVGAYVGHVERLTGISRNQHLSPSQLHAVAAAMARHEGYRGAPTTHNYHIRSTDPKAVAHEVHAIQNRKRRHAVAQADRGVAP